MMMMMMATLAAAAAAILEVGAGAPPLRGPTLSLRTHVVGCRPAVSAGGAASSRIAHKQRRRFQGGARSRSRRQRTRRRAFFCLHLTTTGTSLLLMLMLTINPLASPKPSVAPLSIHCIASESAPHRPRTFQERFPPCLYNVASTATSRRRVALGNLGIHAQPADAAADVRAKFSLP
jgi:hypothetical protein